ncbi:MAG: RidA family protein [Gemmatimonadaceae bacterium]
MSDSGTTEDPRHIAVPGWPRPAGYSNGIVASGRVLAIAGQIGWNPATRQIETEDLVQQTRAALANVVTVLRAAGGEPAHLVRLTWYITDRDAYLARREDIGRAYRDVMGRHYPAMSVVVVAGLIEPRAQVEIEATAVLPS